VSTDAASAHTARRMSLGSSNMKRSFLVIGSGVAARFGWRCVTANVS
jgi:hypothetical protein